MTPCSFMLSQQGYMLALLSLDKVQEVCAVQVIRAVQALATAGSGGKPALPQS